MFQKLRQLGSTLADVALSGMDQAQRADWVDKPKASRAPAVTVDPRRTQLHAQVSARTSLPLRVEQTIGRWTLADDEFAVDIGDSANSFVVTTRRLLLDKATLPLANAVRTELLPSQANRVSVQMRTGRQQLLPPATDNNKLRELVGKAADYARNELSGLLMSEEARLEGSPDEVRYQRLLRLRALYDHGVLPREEYELQQKRLN